MPNTLAGVEQFVSLGTASVTAGGTTAPLAGTQETWTLSGSSLPAASSAAGTGFYMADTLQPSEVILVTNISGTTATVVRGADGTTPVAHVPAFTVIQVATGATFRALQQPWVVLPSGDTTGAADPVNVQNAISTYGHATLVAGFGAYYGNATVTGHEGQFVHCTGTPTWTLTATGKPAFQWTNANSSTYVTTGEGGIRGRLKIVGVSATVNPADGSIGAQMADMPHLECEIEVINCQTGLLCSNQNFFTELARFIVYTQGCTNPVVWQCAASGPATRSGSFDRTELTWYAAETLNGSFGQGGVQLLAGAQPTGGMIKMYGNFGGTGQSAVSALSVSGSAPAGSLNPGQASGLKDVEIITSQEYNGTGTAPGTVFLNTGNFVQACSGNLRFDAFGSGTVTTAGNWDFRGPIVGDSTLQVQLWTVINSGFPAGWSGTIKLKRELSGEEVTAAWALTIATTTVVTLNETLVTLPAGFFYGADTKFLPGTVNGGGLTGNQYAPVRLNTSGVFEYGGAGFTASGSAFFYGQATYPVAV